LDAAATAWVLGDGWRDFDAWPPAESRAVAWFLRSHGRANTAAGDGALSQEAPGDEPPDVYVHDPMAPVPSQGGHSCCVAALTPMGPACQCASERLKVVLVYTTPPLERDIELAGDASVILWAATSAADADFTARLCLVDGDGCSRNLQEGIVRAAFRDSLSHPMPIEAVRPYEYRIELGPVAARIPAGSRIRLDVASSRHWRTGWRRWHARRGGLDAGRPA
jgi:putative CocE/NonD family hydrolase